MCNQMNKLPELSCEIFPPKKDGEFERVFEIIDRIAGVETDFRDKPTEPQIMKSIRIIEE